MHQLDPHAIGRLGRNDGKVLQQTLLLNPLVDGRQAFGNLRMVRACDMIEKPLVI
jgi:hypothetical protein